MLVKTFIDPETRTTWNFSMAIITERTLVGNIQCARFQTSRTNPMRRIGFIKLHRMNITRFNRKGFTKLYRMDANKVVWVLLGCSDWVSPGCTECLHWMDFVWKAVTPNSRYARLSGGTHRARHRSRYPAVSDQRKPYSRYFKGKFYILFDRVCVQWRMTM